MNYTECIEQARGRIGSYCRRAGNVTAEPVKTRCRGREPKASEIPPSATMTNGKKSVSRWTRWSKTVHVIRHWNCLAERFSIRFLPVR